MTLRGTVNEWVSKAEGDYATAARELRATESPNYDAACFHAEHCFFRHTMLHLNA
jgi:HEPN domain-containing protein